MAKLRNIIENIAKDFLDQALTQRNDICTCQTCKNDMLAHVLTKIPAKYVTTDQEALNVIIEQTKVEHQAEFARATLEAITFVNKNPRHNALENKTEAFQTLLKKLHDDRGADFRHYHQELLKRRASIRLRANNMTNYADYLRLLINKPDEFDRLLEVLYINVSEFFRDPGVWKAVRNILEKIILKKISTNDLNLRIWSAGCANGEEPFSLALLIKDILESKPQPFFQVSIIATDIDKKCLDFLKAPVYPADRVKNVDRYFLMKYFDVDTTGYKPKEEIKKMIDFRFLNLTSNDRIYETDVVICRNVFIYFDRNLQEQLLMKFYNSLKPGGYLILGQVETIMNEAREIFNEIDDTNRIYQKK